MRITTCDRRFALDNLINLYPSITIDETHPLVKNMLDFVEKDIIRIPDPKFHPDGAVTPGNKWNDEEGEKAVDACRKFHDYMTELYNANLD